MALLSLAHFLAAALLLHANAQNVVNVPTCGRDYLAEGGLSVNLTDGTYDRCIAVITPPKATKPMPVLFWFHPSGASAKKCGGGALGKLAAQHGFALVCAEALQNKNIFGKGGVWTIPEVQTDATGTRCGDNDAFDIPYIKNAIKYLREHKFMDTYDTTRMFTSGCSMGSGMSSYASSCMKKWEPQTISAFQTHSTGLKVKGDGLNWKRDLFNRKYITAECPECQYFPIKPEYFSDRLGLKACVFDNKQDPSKADPYFYHSSVNLAKTWTALGNKAETHFGEGGHCDIHSYDDIVTCLDDGTGRLLGKSQLQVV